MTHGFRIDFESKEEYERFMEWVNSEELDKTEGIERARALLNVTKEHCDVDAVATKPNNKVAD